VLRVDGPEGAGPLQQPGEGPQRAVIERDAADSGIGLARSDRYLTFGEVQALALAPLAGQKVGVDTQGYDRVAQANAAPFIQQGSGAPSAVRCNMVGLDQYFDTANTRWYTCTTAGSPGTWSANATGSITFADNEVPSGTIDGANETFVLAHAPSPPSSLQVFAGGMLQSGASYTLSGSTVTMTFAPLAGDSVVASYRY